MRKIVAPIIIVAVLLLGACTADPRHNYLQQNCGGQWGYCQPGAG